MRDQLDRLVDEMLQKGIFYDDAQQAIERRFITWALARAEGNLGRAAGLLGIHRNTLTKQDGGLSAKTDRLATIFWRGLLDDFRCSDIISSQSP